MLIGRVNYPAYFVACKKPEKLFAFTFVIRDIYVEELVARKNCIVSPKERDHHPEFLPSARISSAERSKILESVGKEIYVQLKNDCDFNKFSFFEIDWDCVYGFGRF